MTLQAEEKENAGDRDNLVKDPGSISRAADTVMRDVGNMMNDSGTHQKVLPRSQTASQSSVTAEDLLSNDSLHLLDDSASRGASPVETPVKARSNRLDPSIDRLLRLSTQKLTRQLSLEINQDSQLCLGRGTPRKCQEAPTPILTRNIPGLKYFTPTVGFTYYNYGDLNLEKTFGYGGRQQLLEAGLDITTVDRVMVDPIVLARTLNPTLSENVLICSQDDFMCVANFLFFSTIVYYEDPTEREFLEKSLVDLLRSYSGYSWGLSHYHMASAWVNLGAPVSLVLNSRLHGVAWDQLAANKKEKKVSLSQLRLAPLDQTDRQPYPVLVISRTFKLIKDILVAKRTTFREDPEGMKLTVWLLVSAAQHSDIVHDKIATRLVSDILSLLFKILPDKSVATAQKYAVLLTHSYTPVRYSPQTLNWDYHHLPRHFKVLGFNHPHNMVHSLSLLPNTKFGLRIRQMMGYMNMQLILFLPKFQIPGDVTLVTVARLLSQHRELWAASREEHLYCVWALWATVDSILYSFKQLNYELRGPGLKALGILVKMLDDYKRLLPAEDPLLVDPVFLRKVLTTILFRWQNELDRVENFSKMMRTVRQEHKEYRDSFLAEKKTKQEMEAILVDLVKKVGE